MLHRQTRRMTATSPTPRTVSVVLLIFRDSHIPADILSKEDRAPGMDVPLLLAYFPAEKATRALTDRSVSLYLYILPARKKRMVGQSLIPRRSTTSGFMLVSTAAVL